MTASLSEQRPVQSAEDVVAVRQAVRLRAVELGFSLVDQTKIVTAASELARNIVQYSEGGHVILETVERPGGRGLRLTFEDRGPGISNIELAMRDGYSTGGGLGLGLSGARRLSNDFHIESAPGSGTKIVITRWR
jgi:serine/threonine-protein kinase RsbT